MTRWLRWLVAAVVFVPLASLAAPSQAEEQHPPFDRSAWWFELQQVPNVQLPGPATVPEDGMLVQQVAAFESPNVADVLPPGFVSGTTAFGALHFTVEPQSVGTLRLDTALGSVALTATLNACPTITAWNVAANPQAWFTRPRFDSACVAGKVSPDGRSVTFPIGAALTRDGYLDVAIVPAPRATPFAVTFDKPAPNALSVTAPPLAPFTPLVPSVGPAVADLPSTVLSPAGETVVPPLALPSQPGAAPAVISGPTLAGETAAGPKTGRGAVVLATLVGVTAWVVLTRRRKYQPSSLLH